MNEYIVEMRNITKRFPKIIANENVSFGVKKGEIFALLGENGAGKSTLMSVLFGMYEPEEGEIYIRGEKVEIKSPNHATKLNIGMVHQHFKLVDNYTITENIVIGIEPEKKFLGLFPYVDIKETDEKIRKLSKEYGLEVDPTKKIEEVTVSIQQRVEILKMLYREAEILIFDEPTAVLTPQEIEYFLKILESLRDGGKTIILITHKLEEIKRVADRCGILSRGKLVDIREVKDMTTAEMAHLMVGREVDFTLEKSEANIREEVLKVENLAVRGDDSLIAVKNASFSVRKGEVLAIAGVSGNGQVELADGIAGLRKVETGKVYLNGKDITNLSIRERIESGISYIPEDRQKYGLVLDFSLEENLVLKEYYKEKFSKGGVLNKGSIEKNAERLIDKYDIRSAQRSKTIVRSMSGGNQQKAIIGREIELGSDLMIFVQPTRGLDIGAIENIHKRIIELRDSGKAVVLISLELEEVMSVADTIGVIYSGEIVKVENRKNLTKHQVGEFMMGVKNN